MFELAITDDYAQTTSRVRAQKQIFEKIAALWVQLDGNNRYIATEALKECNYSKTYTPHDDATKMFNNKLDRSSWHTALTTGGLADILNSRQREELYDTVMDEKKPVPEFTYENVRATLGDRVADAYRIFAEGLLDVLSNLDRDFQTNKTMKIKSKMIIKWFASSWYRGRMGQVRDLMRAIAIVNGLPAGTGSSIVNEINSFSKERYVVENEWLHILIMKNGNAHLTIKRQEDIDKLNKVIIELDQGKTIGVSK